VIRVGFAVWGLAGVDGSREWIRVLLGRAQWVEKGRRDSAKRTGPQSRRQPVDAIPGSNQDQSNNRTHPEPLLLERGVLQDGLHQQGAVQRRVGVHRARNQLRLGAHCGLWVAHCEWRGVID